MLSVAPANVAATIHVPLTPVTATSWPADFELSSLDGANGFQINGEAASDESGRSVSSAGDVNGDGFADLIVGAWRAGSGSGASYVVFGKASGFGATLELSSLNGINGFQINGEAADDRSGFSVSSAGDVNGDGFDDLIVGAFGADPNGLSSGASYVVFGRASGFGATLELSSLDGANGFQINGEGALDRSGRSAASAGDVNGDGFDDLIVGAPDADPGHTSAAYVVFGKASGFGPTLELTRLDGTNGFKIDGETEGDANGFSVASTGDVNGDGLADLIVGAPDADSNGTYSGRAYVVFGKASGFGPALELSSLDGANGFKINGEVTHDFCGYSVSSAGDVNGDGFDDLIAGAFRADNLSGASYVVFGRASGFSANLDLSSLDGNNGFKISGVGASDYSGFSVSSGGDFNGDGFADLIVGAPLAGLNSSGASYVVFGKASGFSANLDLSSLDGSNGFKIDGEAAYDESGWSVSAAGDVNGDGFDDLIVGASRAAPHGNSSGAAYVIFGHATVPLIAPHPATADAVAAMSFLSWAAYKHGDQDLTSNLDGSHWIAITPSQLSVFSLDTEFYEIPSAIAPLGDGFGFASGFVAVKGDTLAISFRGSQGESPLGDDIFDDWIAAAALQPLYYLEYAPLIQAVLAYIPTYNATHPTDITRIDVTGHSLGGAMAEWFAAIDAPKFGALGLDVSIATFGSPGIPFLVSSNSYLANVLEFGNTEDGVFNHLRALRVLDATGLVHKGIPVPITVPNVTDGHIAFKLIEHGDGSLYEREMRALDASPFGQEFLDTGGRALVIDGLIEPSDEAAIDFSTVTNRMLIIGDSEMSDPAFRDADTIYGGTNSDWIDGGIGDDLLWGNDSADRIVGGTGKDVLNGGNGSDTLAGGDNRDILVGGAGRDTLTGGVGADQFRYAAASDSNSLAFDTITDFDAASDKFDPWSSVTGVDSTVAVGKFSNIATRLDASHLGANHAVLFMPSAGADAGKTFLVIDGNGTAGFQADGDLVIQLDGATNLASLSVGNFI